METFERKEIKYLLSPTQYHMFRTLACAHLADAEYPEGAVTSIYYDTPDDTLINRSIQGGVYKEKLRVRLYGQATPSSTAFVEIKKKFKGITYKRRVACTVTAAQAFLDGMDYTQAIERWPLVDAAAREAGHSRQSLQVAGEIAWMRDRYENLKPKMAVLTHRRSFVDAENPELRITFDADVRWARISDGKAGAVRPLFDGNERILEVKCARAYPRWLVDTLNQCGVHPQSMSKYGRAYEASMSQGHAAPRNRAALRYAS